jgi:hypothetical protein
VQPLDPLAIPQVRFFVPSRTRACRVSTSTMARLTSQHGNCGLIVERRNGIEPPSLVW